MTDRPGRQMGRAAALMMGSVLLSRILGYARDAVIAWQHGATTETDAYFVAFTIPDFLNYLLAGGSLSITFIPIFARYVAEGKEEDGFRSFSTIATVMGIGMLFFIVLGEFLAGRVIPLLAPGFPPAQAALAARLTRIVLPAQIFFYMGGLLMAVQYARKQFFLPALAPLVYNAGIIAGGLLFGRDRGMEGFAWGALAGAFLGNFALQVYGARRGGLSFSPRLDFSDPGLKEFIRLSIPIMLGFSLVVVDEWTQEDNPEWFPAECEKYLKENGSDIVGHAVIRSMADVVADGRARIAADPSRLPVPVHQLCGSGPTGARALGRTGHVVHPGLRRRPWTRRRRAVHDPGRHYRCLAGRCDAGHQVRRDDPLYFVAGRRAEVDLRLV